MPTFLRTAVLCLAVLAGGVASTAQTSPQPAADDPEANLVSELVVTARAPGPAWWTVEKGAAKLYILGLPAGPAPKDLAWDKRLFERRLKEATAVLPPPEASVSVKLGALQGLGLLARMAPGMGWTNGDVEKAMPALLATRFAADRNALGYPVSRYATPAPVFAAFKLQHDYLDKAGLTEEIGTGLVAVARKAKVRVEKPLRVAAPSLAFEDMSLERPQLADCFGAMLSQVETDPERYRASAGAWAAGRLHEALSAPRDPFSLCENRMYSGAFSRKMFAAEVDDLARRLDRPGVTIALLGVRSLLAEDGIIAGLRARGYAVTGPEADAAR
eukprot:gene15841-16002_t